MKAKGGSLQNQIYDWAMLQTNYTETIFDFSLFKPSCSHGTGTEPADLQPVKAPCKVTERLIELFAEITGWVIEFDESEASLQRRNRLASDQPAEGKFSIVDMSADWPAKKPTGHRAKCDELVGLIDHLVSDLQTARVDLSKSRSTLVALNPANDVAGDELLVDSFAPNFELSRRWNDVTGRVDSPAASTCDPSAETEVEDQQNACPSECNSSIGLVQPPFDGWNLAGETGVADNVYLDWLVDSTERISIMSGRIESDLGVGDTQASLTVDPLTCEYLLSGPADFQPFYLWDSDSTSISTIEPSQHWRVLIPGQAIVGTTSIRFSKTGSWADEFADLKEVSTKQLAQILSQSLDAGDCLLVLQRG